MLNVFAVKSERVNSGMGGKAKILLDHFWNRISNL